MRRPVSPPHHTHGSQPRHQGHRTDAAPSGCAAGSADRIGEMDRTAIHGRRGTGGDRGRRMRRPYRSGLHPSRGRYRRAPSLLSAYHRFGCGPPPHGRHQVCADHSSASADLVLYPSISAARAGFVALRLVGFPTVRSWDFASRDKSVSCRRRPAEKSLTDDVSGG